MAIDDKEKLVLGGKYEDNLARVRDVKSEHILGRQTEYYSKNFTGKCYKCKKSIEGSSADVLLRDGIFSELYHFHNECLNPRTQTDKQFQQ